MPLYIPRHLDTVWSADFMSDALSCGRRFRLFNVVDDFNREALHIEVDTSITSERLVRIFDRLRSQRRLPQVLRTDNGPEFLGETFTVVSTIFRTFVGGSLIGVSSSLLLGKRIEQRFHREITPLAPLRTRDVSQSRRDQHQR